VPEPTTAQDPAGDPQGETVDTLAIATAGATAAEVAAAPAESLEALEEVPAEAAIPLTAAQAHRQEGGGLTWMLASIGLVLVVAGWLLPWYVEPTANGIGQSAQDVLTQTLTFSLSGIGNLLVLVVGLCLLGLLVGFVNDLSAGLLRRGVLFRLSRWRVGVALIGALSTLLITGVMSITSLRGPLFGSIDQYGVTDNAVWMTLTGFIVAAFAYGLSGAWLIGITGTVLAVVSWSQGWYATSGFGVATPPSPTHQLLDPSSAGAGDLLLLVVAVGVVVAVVGLLADALAALRGWERPVLRRPRWIIGFAGAAAVLVILIVVSGLHSTTPFGKLTFSAIPGRANTFADNPVWMEMLGLVLCGVAAGVPRLLSRRAVALAVLAFAVGGAFPAIFNQAPDFVAWGARFAVIYVMLALGLNVVVGFAGLLDLGYAAFFAIGAYTEAMLAGYRFGIHLPFFLLIFVGLAMAFTFGAILGAPTLRLRGDYLAIVTLGFGEIVPFLAINNIFGATGGPNGDPADPASLFGHSWGPLGALPANTKYYLWGLLALVALVVYLLRNVERSRLGRAWIAIREDEVAAASTGISTVPTKLLAFSIGASVSGFAGAFFGAMLGTVTPDNFQFAVSVTVLATVVLGGIGNIPGVVVGALLVAFVINWVLPNLGGWATTLGTHTGLTQLGTVSYSQYTYIIFGIILITVMVLRPGGLLPSRARKVELESAGGTSLASVQGR